MLVSWRVDTDPGLKNAQGGREGHFCRFRGMRSFEKEIRERKGIFRVKILQISESHYGKEVRNRKFPSPAVIAQ